MAKLTQIASELADRESIRQCLYRYCRAIDRSDFELLSTVYWPGAIEDHDPFYGSAEDFIEHARKSLGPIVQTSHHLGNVLIDIQDDEARVESYVNAHHRVADEGDQKHDFLIGARYLDIMHRRDDEWRISERVVVRDWFRIYPDSADWEVGLFGRPFSPGLRYPQDKSYEILRQARTV